MRGKLIGWLVVLGVLGLVGAMFTLQNADRVSDLSLNLGFVAWKTDGPQPVPLLMLVSAAVGLLVGGGWGVASSWSSSRRAERAEAQLSMSAAPKVDDWG